MAAKSGGQIDTVMQEDRLFPPSAEFSAQARIRSLEEYQQLWDRAQADPPEFWAELAREELHWFEPFTEALVWNEPYAEWFVGGKTNLCFNSVDRQVESGHGDQVAIIWEGEPMENGAAEIRNITYKDLQRDTAKLADALKAKGVKKGDVVTVYMGMVPELAVAILACARIGAVHSVIFGGFSAQAICDRVEDAKSKVVLTCDGSWRRGKVVPLKANVDHATTLTKDDRRAEPEVQ